MKSNGEKGRVDQRKRCRRPSGRCVNIGLKAPYQEGIHQSPKELQLYHLKLVLKISRRPST